jgi:hypothetical protein
MRKTTVAFQAKTILAFALHPLHKKRAPTADAQTTGAEKEESKLFHR